jgi:hypothetical protein
MDPVRDGRNWFAYVEGDPVNKIDLWGLETANDVATVAVVQEMIVAERNYRFLSTQLALVGEPYVYGGNDLDVDGGLDCSGAVLCGLREMGYDLPDFVADQILIQLTVQVEGAPSPGDLRFLFYADPSGTVDDIADHVQTMSFEGRVNPAGDESNTADNPGRIEFIEGTPPNSGEYRRIDWDGLEEAYGND